MFKSLLVVIMMSVSVNAVANCTIKGNAINLDVTTEKVVINNTVYNQQVEVERSIDVTTGKDTVTVYANNNNNSQTVVMNITEGNASGWIAPIKLVNGKSLVTGDLTDIICTK